MQSKSRFPRVRQAGLGLPEIMVGLAIGLVTALVITQVVTNFEGQKRTTTSGTDAQTSGSVALFLLQRQIQMAGFGLPVFSHQNQPLNCDPSPTVDHDANPATPAIDMVPVVISDGGEKGSDTIAVRTGATAMGGIPVTITNVNAAAKTVGFDTNLGCAVNDIAIAVDGAACSLSKVTALSGKDGVTLESVAGIGTGASFACLGNWTEDRYGSDGGSLTTNGVPSVTGIVNIQAQYGISASPDSNQVTSWVDASGATWAAPTIANRNRIKAVRIAVVSRSGLKEKEDVTQECSSLTEAAPTGLCAWAGTEASPAPKIDLSNDPDWKRYRYRVFETVIPLRNMIWSHDTL